MTMTVNNDDSSTNQTTATTAATAMTTLLKVMTMALTTMTRNKTSKNEDHGNNSNDNHKQQVASNGLFGCSRNSTAEASWQAGVMYGVMQHWQELFPIVNNDIRGNSITMHSCGCSKQGKAVTMLLLWWGEKFYLSNNQPAAATTAQLRQWQQLVKMKVMAAVL